MSRALTFVAVVLALAAVTDCALMQRGKPLEVTYYTPEQIAPGVANRQTAWGPALRLGRVASKPDIGTRIAYGDGLHEVRYYDARRWTLQPEIYVRRSLTRGLFEESGFRRAIDGDAPSLDVEILAFQEVTTPERHEARVALGVVLSADRVLYEGTIAASQPVESDGFEGFVSAMARALDQCSNEVAGRVGSALSAAQAPDHPAPPEAPGPAER
jgi:ABC-type uncharacterized transport system auxiliary subunit